jgi:hypothetical protein
MEQVIGIMFESNGDNNDEADGDSDDNENSVMITCSPLYHVRYVSMFKITGR